MFIVHNITMSFSAPKKRKGENVANFDSDKFVSEKAHKRYYDSVLKHNPVARRGLCVTSINCLVITKNIVRKGWGSFVLNPLLT